MAALVTRRSVLAGVLVPLATPALGSERDPVLAAIHHAEAADAIHLSAGRLALKFFGSQGPRPAAWLAYRARLADARRLARRELHALTPITPEGAQALVAFYAANARRSGDPCSVKAARRKLRRVFARPGAPAMPSLPHVIAPRPPPG